MITLQQQIEALESLIDHYENNYTPVETDTAKATLASLRRLQTIEAQEPVGWTYDVKAHVNDDEELVPDHRAFYVGKCRPLSSYSEYSNLGYLYALPVSPEGYKLVLIEATDRELVAGMEALQRCQQAFLPTITTMEEIRTAMLAASEVSHG